jgi:citrate lyase subunit beta/citryl-CoA lyase
MDMIRVRRSILFMPGSNPRALEKARTLPCDVVALDLEDSVAPEAKVAARQAVCAALGTFAPREVVVRINALSSPWGKDDLAAMREATPDAIILPKVGGSEDIVEARKEREIQIWVMIETAQAILNLAAIAASGVAALVMGTNDLLKDLRAAPMPARENLWPALMQTVAAGRAHGLSLIDGTFNALADQAGLETECAQGKAFGFDGKTLIHPGQIAAANRIFAPGADEIAMARRIITAFERPENQARGAIALDGRMVERLHAQHAAHILAMDAAIAARGG